MKIITVTDAWHPQVNGVVRTIEATNRELERAGHATEVISPLDFHSIPCPGYGEIRLSLLPYHRLARLLDAALADQRDAAIHVATEGPLGYAARRYCRRRALRYSTAYHTRFPQYLHAMFGVPEKWTYALPASFPRIGERRDGADADRGERTARPRVQQRRALDARSGPRSLLAA